MGAAQAPGMLDEPRTPQPLAGLGTCEYALCGYGGAEYPHGVSAYPGMPDMAENIERLASEFGIIIGEGIGQFGAGNTV